MGLSPIAKSSSQLSTNCENFDDFEVSFIGDRKRNSENSGDANGKRRKLSNDFECPHHDTSNGTDKINSSSVNRSNISADVSTSSGVGGNITSIRESNRKLQKSNEELRQQLQSSNTKLALQTSIVDLKSQLSRAHEMHQNKTSAEANQFSEEIQEAKSLNEKLEVANTKLKQEKEELAAEVLRLKQKLDNAIKSKSETNSTVELANQDNMKLKEELDSLKVQVANLQATKANLSVTVERKDKDTQG